MAVGEDKDIPLKAWKTTEGCDASGEMHILQARSEADQVKKTTYSPGQVLVPYDNITAIRISFYSLRLAKSDVFTPRLWEYQWVVDEFIQSLREEDEHNLTSGSLQTSGNNLTLLDKKFQSNGKEADWDSGFSDG